MIPMRHVLSRLGIFLGLSASRVEAASYALPLAVCAENAARGDVVAPPDTHGRHPGRAETRQFIVVNLVSWRVYGWSLRETYSPKRRTRFATTERRT